MPHAACPSRWSLVAFGALLAAGMLTGPGLAAPSRAHAGAVLAAAGDTRLDWWREARFGMFIHWGLYAVPAGEWNGRTDYGEWIRNNAKIPIDDYEQFRARFNPVDVRRRRVGTPRPAGGHEVHRHHVEAPRRVRAVRLGRDRLGRDVDAVRARHPEAARGRVPARGHPALLLPLDHGLASSRLPAAAGLGGRVATGGGRRLRALRRGT